MAERPEALRVGVVNGPNLNLLGQRQPEIYGSADLTELNARLRDRARSLEVQIDFYQSNIEGEIVDWIQAARAGFDGLLVNAAAYTHTSVAIRDALLATEIPFVEVHLSNVHAREAFRHASLLSDIAVGVVMGFGGESYELALTGLVSYLRG